LDERGDLFARRILRTTLRIALALAAFSPGRLALALRGLALLFQGAFEARFAGLLAAVRLGSRPLTRVGVRALGKLRPGAGRAAGGCCARLHALAPAGPVPSPLATR
jgi:hypothetical protein